MDYEEDHEPSPRWTNHFRLRFPFHLFSAVSNNNEYCSRNDGEEEDAQDEGHVKKIQKISIKYGAETFEDDPTEEESWSETDCEELDLEVVNIYGENEDKSASDSVSLSPLSHRKPLNWKAMMDHVSLFWQMAWPYFYECVQGRWLLAGLLGWTLVQTAVNVAFSYTSKDIWDTLSAKNATMFWFALLRFLVVLAVGAPVVTYFRFQREQLAVHWREWMTTRTLQLYTANRAFYKLGEDDTMIIDNPDQRVSEDVDAFTSFSLHLLVSLLTSFIDLCCFSVILGSIYPALFIAIIIYATSGTILTLMMGHKLVGFNKAQLQKEADFRYSLVRLRDNAESIAFFGGEDLEGRAIRSRLGNLVDNQREINKAQRDLELFTATYRYLVEVLPVAVVAPRFFSGQIAELGIITQSVSAFNHILNDLSIIVDQFESLSEFSASIQRLSSFYRAMQVAGGGHGNEDSSQLLGLTEKIALALDKNVLSSDIVESQMGERANTLDQLRSFVGGIKLVSMSQKEDSTRKASATSTEQTPLVLSIRNLHLRTPNAKRVLIHNISLELHQGEHMIIVGNSGCGKSSLLRAIAGLWTTGAGSIVRPRDDEVFFLPQRPYCTTGTLKDQLLYPSQIHHDESSKHRKSSKNDQEVVPRKHSFKHSLTDAALLQVLEEVDLIDVAKRSGDGDAFKGLHTDLNWSNMLSLGEQQRLAFGRLLVNRPRLIILDEATSALDPVTEARMYQLLKSMAGKTQMTYISVGHRPCLLRYHEKRLRLAGAVDDFDLSEIDKDNAVISSSIENL